MENTIKNTIEKGKFKLKLVTFNQKTKNLIGYSRGYFLEYKGKKIFLGLKRNVEKTFRDLLKKTYGDIWFKDYPNSYFKRWIKKQYDKQTKATKKTNIKKKPYYEKMRIERKKNKIKRLKEELRALNERSI